MGWGKWWHVYFNSGKIQLASLGRLNKCEAIDVKIDEPVLEKKLSCNMLCLLIFNFKFKFFNRVQKWVCEAIGPALADFFEPLRYPDMASLYMED